MPILAQNMADQMRFALDAEDAEHYRDDRDIIPAINASQRWLVNVINATLGENKFGEEIFRDLTKARVFRTSRDSRLRMTAFPHEVWTILAVYPNPETGTREGSPATPTGTDLQSFERTDLYHISSTKSAKRLSVEEWANNRGNPFEAGYEGSVVCDELKDYAYLDPIDYGWDNDENTLIKEIEIRPKIDKDLVTVMYVKRPTPIALLTEFIEFPDEVFQMLLNKALQYIAYQQGDQTTIFTVTQADIQTLLASFS